MDFSLTDGQKVIQSAARRFALEELRPRLATLEREDRFQPDVWQAMKNYAFWGLPYPKEYGGTGSGYISYILAMEEISRESAAIGATLSVHTLAADAIFHYGTEDQKRQFLPPLLTGEMIGSFSFTEAATGSDPEAITTMAIRKQSGFELNGRKMFSSNSTLKGVAIVFAKGPENDGQISAFIVPKQTNGFLIGERVRKIGLSGFETAPFSLREVSLPEESLLGGDACLGKGFQILTDIISIGRLGIAAQSLGLAERALEESLIYANQRKQLRKSIKTFPTIQCLIAEMATEIEASRGMIYKAAALKEAGRSIVLDGAMAKLYCTESAKRVIDKAMSVHGCYAYTKEFTVERLYRDVKLGELYEGVNEMQKIIIAARVLHEWQSHRLSVGIGVSIEGKR